LFDRFLELRYAVRIFPDDRSLFFLQQQKAPARSRGFCFADFPLA
jgi:hypothetical protein